MIQSFYTSPDALRSLHWHYSATAPSSLLLPASVDDASTASLRARLLAAGWTPFEMPTRGQYDVNESHVEATLFDEMRWLAEGICGRPLRVASARWTRLRHRAYAGLPDDLSRRIADKHVELTLDFSNVSCGEAQTFYVGNQHPHLVLPQLHGSIAIVERHPGTLRYERYLSYRLSAVQVHRLRLSLSPA